MGERRKADFELPSAEGQAGYPADMTPMGDQVERFSHTPERMLATGNGDWVRYSDYEKLNERLNEATDARVYYREKLKRAEAERDQARKQVLEEVREGLVSPEALSAAWDAFVAQYGGNIKAPVLAAFDSMFAALHPDQSKGER